MSETQQPERKIPIVDPTIFMLDQLAINDRSPNGPYLYPLAVLFDGPTIVLNDEMCHLLGDDLKPWSQVLKATFATPPDREGRARLSEVIKSSVILHVGLETDGKKAKSKIVRRRRGLILNPKEDVTAKNFLEAADVFHTRLSTEIQRTNGSIGEFDPALRNGLAQLGIGNEELRVIVANMQHFDRLANSGFVHALDRNYKGNPAEQGLKRDRAFLIQKTLELAFVGIFGPKNIPSETLEQAFRQGYAEYGKSVWELGFFQEMTSDRYVQAIKGVLELLNNPNEMQQVSVEQIRHMLYICDALFLDPTTGIIRYHQDYDKPVLDGNGNPHQWSVQEVAQRITDTLEKANCLTQSGSNERGNSNYGPVDLESGLMGRVSKLVTRGRSNYLRLWNPIEPRKKENMPCWDCEVRRLCKRHNDVMRANRSSVINEDRHSGIITRYLHDWAVAMNPPSSYRGYRPLPIGFFIDPDNGLTFPIDVNKVLDVKDKLRI